MSEILDDLEDKVFEMDERLRDLEEVLLADLLDAHDEDDDAAEPDPDVEDALDLFDKIYEPVVEDECDAFVCGYIEGLSARV